MTLGKNAKTALILGADLAATAYESILSRIAKLAEQLPDGDAAAEIKRLTAHYKDKSDA